MNFESKIPELGESIFSVVSKMAKEHDAINLGQGFPDYDCNEKLRNFVTDALNDGKNQYCPMAGAPELRAAIKQKVARTYKVDLDLDTEICVTAGATQALFTAITAFVKAGEEVIIIEPAYDCYKPTIYAVGGIPITYEISSPDYKIDWQAFSALVTERTKMIIINTPHNPTGSILTATDLIALESLVSGKDIVVISDEVYEHLIYDKEEHQSVLKYPQLYQQSLAVYSFGKTLHTTGWKMGYVLGPQQLMNEFKNIHQWNVYCVSSFVQYGIANYLNDPSVYEDLSPFFQAKRDTLQAALKGSGLKALSCSGTYFQLFDYGDITQVDDRAFTQYMVEEVGVAVIPISPFCGADYDSKVIRMCFAKKDSTIQAAAECIASNLGKNLPHSN